MAFGGIPDNMDPTLYAMGMGYGGSVTPMVGGMGMGGMGMGGMFGGMMPGMGGYGPNAVPLPPGVTNASASGENSPYGPITPTQDNFNGKVLPPPEQEEKKKRNTQNILLAAGIAISSIALLALTHGRGGGAAKKQVAEDADRLRENNHQQHTELVNEREKSGKYRKAFEAEKLRRKELATKNAVLQKQAERAYKYGNASDSLKAQLFDASSKDIKRRDDILKQLEPQELARLLAKSPEQPKSLESLQRKIPWVKVPYKGDDVAMKHQSDELLHSIVLHANKNALPLIQDIGNNKEYIPNALLKISAIPDTKDRAVVLDALFSHPKLKDEMTYPVYDLTKINPSRIKDEPYPQSMTTNAKGTLTPVEETGSVESFINHYIEVLKKDGKTADMNQLEALLAKKKQAEQKP